MKILLIGDASNFHPALAAGLRQLGQDVTVASEGSGFMKTARQIDLRRHLPGKLGGAELYLNLLGPLRSKLRGYDIVSVINPIFLSLRPHRIRKIFNQLKNDNGAVFLTALATDWPFIEECFDPSSPLTYSEFRLDGQPGPYAVAHPEVIEGWQNGPLRDWTEEFYSRIDGAVSALYEYHLALQRRLSPEKIAYGGLPIQTDDIRTVEIPSHPSPIRIFLGRHAHRMAEKGTDRFEIAIRRALDRHPGRGELVIVENRPYNEYLQLMRSAHLVVDQAYSFTPATNALLAMAHGIPTVSGAEPSYYSFIGLPPTPAPEGLSSIPPQYRFDADHPIYNSPTDVDAMTDLFCHILTHPEELRQRGIASRGFVERHHNARLVASRFLSAWLRQYNYRGVNQRDC